jgi:hypothetical protein
MRLDPDQEFGAVAGRLRGWHPTELSIIVVCERFFGHSLSQLSKVGNTKKYLQHGQRPERNAQRYLPIELLRGPCCVSSNASSLCLFRVQASYLDENIVDKG